MSRTESELIADAIEHLEVLRSYVERADLDEQIIADAVSLRLAAALECLAHE